MYNKAHMIGASAVTLLLLAGAGCAAKPQVTTQAGANANIQADVEAQKPGFGASIDAFFESMMGTDKEEQTEENTVEGEAEAVNNDSVEINSYSESSYDLQ